MPTGQPTAPTALVDEGITVSGGTYTTSAFTPTSGRLYYLVAIYRNDTSSAWTGTGSVSQTGMTWTRVDGSLQWDGSAAFEVFRSLPSSYSSGSQAATITPPTAPGTLQNAVVAVVEVQDPDTSGTNGSGATLGLFVDSATSGGTAADFTQERNADETEAYSAGWDAQGEINLMIVGTGQDTEAMTWGSGQNVSGNIDGYTDLKTGDAPAAPTELTDTGQSSAGRLSIAYTRQGAAAAVAAGAQGTAGWTTADGTVVAALPVKVATAAPDVTSDWDVKTDTYGATAFTTTASPVAGDLQLVVSMDRSGGTPTLQLHSTAPGDTRGWTLRTVNTDPGDVQARHSVAWAWREVESGDSTTQFEDDQSNTRTWQEFWVTPSDLTGTIAEETDAADANIAVQTDSANSTTQRMHGRVDGPATLDGIVLGIIAARNGSFSYTTPADGVFNSFTLRDTTSNGGNQNERCLQTVSRDVAGGELAAPVIAGDTVDQEMTLVTLVFNWGVSGAAAGGIVVPRLRTAARGMLTR